MPRLRVVVALSIAFALVACGGSEQLIVDRFFQAVKDQDTDAIVTVSAAAFPWDVNSWEIVQVGEESTEPFQLRELRRKASQARKSEEACLKQLQEFERENYDALSRVQKRLDSDPDFRFKGRLGEVQTTWETKRKEWVSLKRQTAEHKERADLEVKMAKMSLMSTSSLDDWAGDVASKDLMVTIRTQDGSETPYRMTLRIFRLTNQTNQFTPQSRWIISNIEEVRI